MKLEPTIPLDELKLCINCVHFNPPEKQTIDGGNCYHPKNVSECKTHSPVTGEEYPTPKVELKYAGCLAPRMGNTDCGMKAEWYEPKPLTTLVKESTGEAA
jgi:hypothetical protein